MTTKVQKAYKNPAFISSRDARTIRILAEYLEPAARFRDQQVKDTIVFFGSARLVDSIRAKKIYEEAQELYEKKKNEETQKKLHWAKRQLEMSRYYDDARELARLLTKWSRSIVNSHHRFIICSGGGPGIMEAANRGAADVPEGKSIGLNISIPLEQDPNNFITPELNFEFHYFFMRKFWFIYLAKALVVFPGGFGTLDELFEVLTLIQTNKLQKKMPVVLYGKEYWNNVVNFQYMVDHLVIDEEDLKLFKIVDNVPEAFEYLKGKLTELFL